MILHLRILLPYWEVRECKECERRQEKHLLPRWREVSSSKHWLQWHLSLDYCWSRTQVLLHGSVFPSARYKFENAGSVHGLQAIFTMLQSCTRGPFMKWHGDCKQYLGIYTCKCVHFMMFGRQTKGVDRTGALDAHCSKCGCTHFFKDTMVLAQLRHQMVWEIIEAFHIRRKQQGASHLSHWAMISLATLHPCVKRNKHELR